mgnify:CR=1 FL=1
MGRFDGKRARGIPNYRRIMPFLMRRRNESVVYFKQTIDLEAASEWIADFNGRHDERITVFHVALAAIAKTLHERPRLNRFVSGRKLYQRKGVWLSFAAKKGMNDDAPLSVIRREFPKGEPFLDFVRSLRGDIQVARSDEQSSVDKELRLAFKFPAPVIGAGVRVIEALDRWNLAPKALIGEDPMYSSAFVANLGSLKIDAAYHHLYEHGNNPIFVTIGRIAKRPMVIDDEVVPRLSVELKYSYDERIEDGFYCAQSISLIQERIADPASWCES